MKIEVVRETTPLRRDVWTFYTHMHGYSNISIILDCWEPQERASKRHKWVRATHEPPGINRQWRPNMLAYIRRSHNGANLSGWTCRAKDVPFPDDVVAEAKAALLASLTVTGPVDPEEEQTMPQRPRSDL